MTSQTLDFQVMEGIMFRILIAIALLALLACGELQGPAGPPGPTGPSGSSELDLIEQTLTDDEYDEDSYVIYDVRISPSSVVAVYIKAFYTNTGDPYFTPFELWTELHTSSLDAVLYQVRPYAIRFFDPNKKLDKEIVVIACLPG